MNRIDPNIERLIVRQLDGEITDDEQLRLNRELLKNPSAHQLWETYRDLDRAAGEILGEVLVPAQESMDQLKLPVQSAPHRLQRLRRYWLMATGAVAAAVLALAIPKPALSPNPEDGEVVSNHLQERPTGMTHVPVQRHEGDRLMRNVGMPQIKRNTGRNVFGVMDEIGNVYWIEVDRTRTLRRPPAQDLPRNLRETL